MGYSAFNNPSCMIYPYPKVIDHFERLRFDGADGRWWCVMIERRKLEEEDNIVFLIDTFPNS